MSFDERTTPLLDHKWLIMVTVAEICGGIENDDNDNEDDSADNSG